MKPVESSKEDAVKKLMELNKIKINYNNSTKKIQEMIISFYESKKNTLLKEDRLYLEEYLNDQTKKDCLTTSLLVFKKLIDSIGESSSIEHDEYFIIQITDNLRALINILPLKEDALKQINTSLAKISYHKRIKEIPTVINHIATNIDIKENSLIDEFENYLEKLENQFSFFNKNISLSDEENKEISKSSEDFNSFVRTNISEISTNLTKDDNSGEINSRLTSIIKNFDSFYQVMQEKHDNQLKRNQELSNRISQMDEEHKKMKKIVEAEVERSTKDYLTGLYNRFGFENLLSKIISEKNTGYCICVADIDHFKSINDNYGHITGDKALQIISNIMIEHFGDNNFVCRTGGEEFVIIINNTLSKSIELCEFVRKKVSEAKFVIKDTKLNITISMGVTELTLEDSMNSVYARADELMYKSKESGRNKVSY